MEKELHIYWKWLTKGVIARAMVHGYADVQIYLVGLESATMLSHPYIDHDVVLKALRARWDDEMAKLLELEKQP